MKHFLVLSILTFFFSSKVKTGIDEVVAAMRSGNSTLIAKYFDDRVDISMPDKSNSYSKSQAELVLKDFFSNNPVKNFANDSGFNLIGNMTNRGRGRPKKSNIGSLN
jgi:hypothetical protein